MCLGYCLTKTYNRFHNPEERSPDILRLRDLHAQMDRAVLDAYGWSDILPTYDFREQLDESTRLTWAEDTRDEVLARLLELNRVMASREAEESAAAEGASRPGSPRRRRRARRKVGTLRSYSDVVIEFPVLEAVPTSAFQEDKPGQADAATATPPARSSPSCGRRAR